MAGATTVGRILAGLGWALNAGACFGVGAVYVYAGAHRHDAWLFGVAAGIGLVGAACLMGMWHVWRHR